MAYMPVLLSCDCGLPLSFLSSVLNEEKYVYMYE